MGAVATEINFDGLIGPTHNYAGLSYGNVASAKHVGQVSSPQRAALEGLAKMRRLAELGVGQAVLPPQPRPDVRLLRAAGFAGDDAAVIARAAKDAPQLLAACYSASSMWAANAATVSPSADTADGRVHFTPANLISTLHRSIEPAWATRVLRAIFADEKHFVVHDPLPAAAHFADEGAANHTRLCRAFGDRGVELFAFGRDPLDVGAPRPVNFPARQTRLASEAIARRHQVGMTGTRGGSIDEGTAKRTGTGGQAASGTRAHAGSGARAESTGETPVPPDRSIPPQGSSAPSKAMFIHQHPDAIDAGVFHNDVISVGHQHVLLYHERAFVDTAATVDRIARAFEATTGGELIRIEVSDAELPLADAVASYLFNSQIVTLPGGEMALICPAEARENGRASAVIDRVVSSQDNPIAAAHVADLRQSMQNGGGPACLRLRVVLTDDEQAAMHPGVRWSPALDEKLVACVEKHYRDALSPADLADPKLIAESRDAVAAIHQALGMADFDDFTDDDSHD